MYLLINQLIGNSRISHVFISYSRKDSLTVNQIAARLSGDGFDIWLDRKAIKGGELWRETIVGAVDHAYACVLMLSPNSAASDNVRKEVDLSEGANKEIVPVVLAPVELPAKLRYQLAGIQWIEYYRDPEAKYRELAEVLHARAQRQSAGETPPRRAVEIVILGLNPSELGPKQREKLLSTIAEITNTPRSDLKLTAVRAGSVHAFVDMPADAAYRLKTAALNRDALLIDYGIDALRLTGDRYFVSLKTGQIGPLNPRKPGRGGFTGTLVLLITLFLAALILAVGFLLASPFMSSFFPTAVPSVTYTFTSTNTLTSTPASTDTVTETPTSTPSQTSTPTNTFTATPTKAPTFTPSRTVTLTSTFTSSPTATNIPSPPSTFFDPIVSTSHFGCGTAMSKVLTIQEIVVDPSGVSAVEIYFWLINKTTGEKRFESSLQMTFVPAGLFSHWKRDISLPDIQDYPPQDYWFQFRFMATDNTGVQSSSLTYSDLVTFTSCIVPPA